MAGRGWLDDGIVQKSRSGPVHSWRDLSVAHVPEAGFWTASRVGFRPLNVLFRDRLETEMPGFIM